MGIFTQALLHIHPFSIPVNPIQGRGGVGAYPSCPWARGRVHPGQVASPSQGPVTYTFIIVPFQSIIFEEEGIEINHVLFLKRQKNAC